MREVSLESIAGNAWAFRHWVERDATRRLARLAKRLARIGTHSSLVKLAIDASADEEKHADYCGELAARFHAPLLADSGVPSEIWPSELTARQRVLYEAAAVCLAETESTSMLVTLMGEVKTGSMKRLLREFSRDEVKHAQFGWAVLASHKDTDDLSFLAQWIPWMLTTTAGESFTPSATGPEDRALIDVGVMPFSMRKKVFTESLTDVIFPGLERLGIDAEPSRAWLAPRDHDGAKRLG